jgi:DMSO/TMAO reductase YedYZ molybdopterin-dependent catalytic subunit
MPIQGPADFQGAAMPERITSETVTRKVRIPPGQRRTEKFPVLDLGIHPDFDEKAWRLKVWGEVETPFELTWKEFKALPRVGLHADFHCVTRWSQLDLEWEGVHVREILKRAKPTKDAKGVMAHGMEGYTTNIDIKDLDDDDVILADTLRGEPLSKEHGGPLRLLVPKLYGWKSCKFLNGLQFLPTNEPGFWEQRGYHMRGEVLAEERFW